MSKVYIESVGLFAPGLVGWQQSLDVLCGVSAYQQQPLPKYKPLLLPANERRRASAVVRLAFGACEDAVGEKLAQASTLAAVFASSGGDYAINDQICRTVMTEQKAVSPTQFHNSVHNAAAGYWSIASKSQAPSVSLSACDFSVATGLIEAQMLVVAEQCPVLLVCCDTFVVPPMDVKRPVKYPFSAALWLTPEPTDDSLAAITLELDNRSDKEAVTAPINTQLAYLYQDNPAARVLPLLELIARQQAGTVNMAMAGKQSLAVQYSPCL